MFEAIAVFIIGLAFGSFMNVLVYRLPRDLNIAFPPSECPVCSNRIRPYDNIPVIGYLLLGGKCRDCKTKISIQYPIVEIITGLMALAVYFKFGLGIEAVKAWIFVFLLLGAGFTDFFTAMDPETFECGMIPDTYSLGGLAAGVALSFFTQIGWKDSLIGAGVGFLALYLPAYIYLKLRKKEGMGGGDLKLVAMIGAFLGWKSIYFVIFLSATAGVIVGLPATMILKDKDYMMPYGPFIVLAAFAYLFFGGWMDSFMYGLI